MNFPDKINDYFLKKLTSLSANASEPVLDKIIKKSIELSSMNIDSDDKFKKLFFIKSAAKDIGAKLSFEEKAKLLNANINNLNDAYYNIINLKLGNAKIKKVAYPNFTNAGDRIGEEFDINKWLEVVHLIYDAVAKKEMKKENALDYYSNFLDIENDEDLKFKKWFEYYSKGEHLKYSSKEDEHMKKKSVYMSNLGQGGTPYYHEGGSAYLGKGSGKNMPGDSFDASSFDRASGAAKGGAEDAGRFNSWKEKLHTAIRRIDKLLRKDKYVEPETYKLLAEYLLNLSLQVHTLKLSSTASDITHRTSNMFKKAGYSEGADILRKVAQEIPDPMAPEELEPEQAPPVAAAPEAAQVAPEMPEAEELTEEESEPKPTDNIPRSDDVEPVSLEDITPMPGAREGEYEELAGDISLEDAANKLDEVAGLLADRRIIRQLAEFDIMLDKIGIASMFPELAESQSKLIDAFSYALTRVTKMMGQLASAKTLASAQAGLPGQEEAEQETPAPEPEAAEVI